LSRELPRKFAAHARRRASNHANLIFKNTHAAAFVFDAL